MPTAQTTVNLAHVQTDAGDANHGRTPLAVQPLTQGLWRREIAGAPIHGVIAQTLPASSRM
jgi:hypothetical protein